MTKKAKFFCESCGSEVKANARVCPTCGKFFASVRCPNCGKMGTVEYFKKGCPVCHYAMSEAELYGIEENTPQNKSNTKSRKAGFSFGFKGTAATSSIGEGVPTWLLVASLVVLVGIALFGIIRFHMI